MKTWIALLRGINVGGRNRLPMASLSKLFTQAGCARVRTYIQSGNVVFKADISSRTSFAESIGHAIEQEHGFRPAIVLLTRDSLRSAIAANPYPETEPKSLHIFFLESIPEKAQVQDAKALLADSESIQVVGRHLFLRAPDGIGRSRFVKGVEKTLGMRATARNWKTVSKLVELANDDD
ncbi:DUF1697 domain-containing protein [Lentisalinibacter salinarum]|uniref:DUF1697 domain-containing protein n=1 Tax=Lentisalinibacter salinarum TaxID=2992239 RepID=UPI003863B749